MTYKDYQIGEICSLVKGESPAMKTEPGGYPLVVTAAYRRTASTYQLEGPAVCIPLVSSTGHGDAALHRVHFQEGKFALSNLLVALLPKNPTTCDLKYLYFLLTAKKDEYFVPLMLGTANVSLKIRDIAQVQIPLPPLTEQHSIVACIEKLAAMIEEARALRRRLEEECEILCRSVILGEEGKPTPMRNIVKLRECDTAVKAAEAYEFAGVYCFGRGVFKGRRKSGSQFAYQKLTRIKAGNFVYPKLMAWEGALGIVPKECDGLVVSQEFPVFELDENQVLPETLDVYFRMPSVWPRLAEISTGTNVRRRRLHPSAFLNFEVPLPSMKTQVRLRNIRQVFARLQPIQAQTAAELDALMPSILSRAFAGEMCI